VGISAPPTGTVDTTYIATATVAPPDASLPVVYRWQATGQEPVTHTTGLSDTVVFTWQAPDTQTITVTAWNECSEMLSATHPLAIEGRQFFETYLPLVIQGANTISYKKPQN
jgi:hypothetical protein